jgi:hypothetical protein
MEVRPDAGARLREATRYIPLAILIFVASRILFDLLADKPMFWSSDESLLAFLWSGLIAGPFILFALMVSAQKNKSGN